MPTDSWQFPLEHNVFPPAAAIVAGENPALWPANGGPLGAAISGGAGLSALAWGYSARAFVYIEDVVDNYGGSDVGNLVPRTFAGRTLTLSGLGNGTYNVEVWATRPPAGILTTLNATSAGGSLAVALPTIDRDIFLKVYLLGTPGAKVYDSASRTVAPGSLGAADTGGVWTMSIGSTIYTPPPTAPASPVTATVDLTNVVATVAPTYVGTVCTTFGARPDSNFTQAAAEAALDARYIRIPVGWRSGRVTGSATGGPTNFNLTDLMLAYPSNFHFIICIGGETTDWDVAAGDATHVINAIVSAGIPLTRVDFTSSNEPDNSGHTPSQVITQAQMIQAELAAVVPGQVLLGPVWASGYSGKRTDMQTYLAGMTNTRVNGDDWHHYAMGGSYLSFAAAMADAATMLSEVALNKTDLAADSINPYVAVDEFNYSWQYNIGGHGNVAEFFQAEETLYIAAMAGYILKAGGACNVYGTQNGALGVYVDNQGLTEYGGRAQSSPMPAYFGIQAWTGASVWPHFNDKMLSTGSPSNSDVIVFACSNTAGGYNLVLINLSQSTAHQFRMNGIAGGMNGYDAWQTVRANPWGAPVQTFTNIAISGGSVWMNLPACTVTTVVLKP